MRFIFEVTVEIERETGKFCPKDELGDELIEALEQADPGCIGSSSGDCNAVYNTIDWAVSDVSK